jgi:hypothetical protein
LAEVGDASDDAVQAGLGTSTETTQTATIAAQACASPAESVAETFAEHRSHLSRRTYDRSILASARRLPLARGLRGSG